MKNRFIKLQTPFGKWLAFAPFVFLAAIAFFVGRWAVGGTTATQLRFTEEPSPAEVSQVLSVGKFAVGLAPEDPQAHLLVGILQEKSFQPEATDTALGLYEKAAALSPDDYRYWVGYARAAERYEQTAIAERAAERALQLAPSYGVTNWTLGNIRLRADKTDEAFPLLSKAVIAEPLYAPAIFGLILDRNNDDSSAITRLLGNSPEINRVAVAFFAKQKRPSDALTFWKQMSAEQKSSLNPQYVREVAKDLTDAGGFRTALIIQEESRPSDDSPMATLGKITDGGFEGNFLTKNQSVLTWNIADGEKPEIGANLEDKHGGNQSLILAFRGVRTEFRSIEQVVAVDSNKSYRLEFFAKSQNLKTEHTLRVEVVDTNENKVLASSAALATGTTDWQKFTADFTTDAETQGVKIRLVRMPCVGAACEINGFVRLDDFSLTEF